MPQISLKISSNIDIGKIDFKCFFKDIHEALKITPNLDISTCQSGVIQESHSYIGQDDPNRTKIFLEILWLENDERAAMKNTLAQSLIKVMENHLKQAIEIQQLSFAPRLRISNLGKIDQDYYIPEHGSF